MSNWSKLKYCPFSSYNSLKGEGSKKKMKISEVVGTNNKIGSFGVGHKHDFIIKTENVNLFEVVFCCHLNFLLA